MPPPTSVAGLLPFIRTPKSSSPPLVVRFSSFLNFIDSPATLLGQVPSFVFFSFFQLYSKKKLKKLDSYVACARTNQRPNSSALMAHTNALLDQQTPPFLSLDYSTIPFPPANIVTKHQDGGPYARPA